MDTRKSAAERMRPILQAMERSIESVRRTRVNQRPEAPASGLLSQTPAQPQPPIAQASAPQPPARPQPNPAIPLQINSPAPYAAPRPGLPAHLIQPHTGGETGDAPPRLKARPKRLDPSMPSSFDQSAYRSKAS